MRDKSLPWVALAHGLDALDFEGCGNFFSTPREILAWRDVVEIWKHYHHHHSQCTIVCSKKSSIEGGLKWLTGMYWFFHLAPFLRLALYSYSFTTHWIWSITLMYFGVVFGWSCFIYTQLRRHQSTSR